MHRDLPRQLQIINPAFQIIARRAQIAQFLRPHHLIGFGGGFHRSLARRNVGGVEVFQLGLARRDVEAQLVIEGQRLAIQNIQGS